MNCTISTRVLSIPALALAHATSCIGRALLVTAFSLAACWGTGSDALASTFGSGNVLLVNTTTFSPNGTKLYEFTPTGQLVQSVDVPGELRSVVVDKNGNAQIYNGTFGVQLTTYNSTTGTITHTPIPDLWTFNNLTYGSIAAFSDYVYLTNMQPGQAPGGVVRVNVDDYSIARIADFSNPISLNIGLDGKLYTLTRGTAFGGGGNLIRVYDPTTLQPIRNLSLPFEHRALAVDANGTIYADGISRYTPNGLFIDSHPVNGNTSVRLTNDGRVVTGNWAGVFSLTDTTFANVFSFNLNPHQPFSGGAALVVLPIPEPSTIVIAIVGVLGLVACCWRRKR